MGGLNQCQHGRDPGFDDLVTESSLSKCTREAPAQTAGVVPDVYHVAWYPVILPSVGQSEQFLVCKIMAARTDKAAQCSTGNHDCGSQSDVLTSVADVKPATSVLHDPQLGRVLVATRSFAVGDVVLREPPLLTFDSLDGGPNGLFNMFLAASGPSKAAILDMFHPPLEGSSQRIKDRRQEAQIHAKQLGMDFTVALKLLLIRDTNAHAFFGEKQEYEEVPAMNKFDNLSAAPKYALFDLGSKAAHSCNPNIEYSSKQYYGLEYRAIRPILEGDYLLISYIDDLWTSSQIQRQNILLESKFFLCKCSRCIGKDDCRAVTCTKCKTRPAFPVSNLMSAAPIIGSTVDVRGLEVHSELNGESGTVESIATDVGRYGVKLTRGELVAVKIENLYKPESWQCACGHTTARTDVRRKEEGIREEMESAILDAHCTLNLVTPKRLDDRKGRRERMLPAFGSWLLRKESQQLERWNAWQLAVVVWR